MTVLLCVLRLALSLGCAAGLSLACAIPSLPRSYSFLPCSYLLLPCASFDLLCSLVMHAWLGKGAVVMMDVGDIWLWELL